MSENKKKKTDNTEQEQKIVTKYDLKMQKRKEEKEKEKKQERIGTIAGVAVVIALVCLVASFPIRTYLATHETYVEINGEKVTRVEFDYNYNLAKNSYINQYGTYMSYFGIDLSGDLSALMYSDTLTWKDFFEQQAVENMTQNKALKMQADAAGFTYDATEEYGEFEQALKEAAAAAGVSVKEYMQAQYGPYATKGRISGLIKNTMFLNAYYEQVLEEKTPSDDVIEAYYQENPNTYDSVDYRVSVIEAVMPTEPTELADTAAAAEAVADAAAGTGAADTEQTYEPSDAEKEKAMADAKVLADAAEATIAKVGELTEKARLNEVEYSIREWLFDSSRRAGDTTVVEDAANYCYYVAAFESRYRDETPSVDARVLITDTMDGQEILDEWKNGGATEESFGELCEKYGMDAASETGGLYEELVGTDMDEILAAWLYDSARQPGDTASLTGEDGSTYVMYYVKANIPKWKIDARNTLLEQTMADYLEEIQEGITVVDSKGRLNYLKAAAEGDENADSSENPESGESAGSSESAESGENADLNENAGSGTGEQESVQN